MRPPLKTAYARPAASVRNGSQSFLLARSRSGQLPLPAPACGGHAKPSVPSTFRVSPRRARRLRASPARTRQTGVHGAAGCTASARRDNDRRCDSGKRWYDAAVQAQTPRPGGSVRGQKGASGSRGYAAAEKARHPSGGASHHAG
ncbi:hypothetical protein [Erwinia pyrifoliae]|uniref:Uncharacterized protein n=1 Tax=Erwinia pyrifoliae TaxID=79967 RepID=A0ABY5X728_ERWPY|nr:hypothetical protein [Erwinia pyrifoliae]UWS33191.1 hypothetical protein NYP84_16605 [Erwinia pyrifoliae]